MPGDAIDLPVRVQPRAHRDEIAGARGGRLLIRVTAPPVDGKANAAACALVAKTAGVPKSHVAVVRGGHARDKVLRISGVADERALRTALGL